MAVLPRAPRRNKMSGDTLLAQPRRDPLRNELRTIITLHIDWSATLGKPPLQDLHHLIGGNRPGAEDSQPLPRVLVQHRQALQAPPIRGRVMNKVIAPNMVGMRRPSRRGSACAHWTPWPLFLNDLESLALAEIAHRLAIDSPMFTRRQVVDFSIAKAWILLRQRMNMLAPLGLVRLAGLPPLRTAVQRQDPVSPPLTDVICLVEICGRLALGSQAYQFFPSTPFSMRLSRRSSPRSRFNAAFSRSRIRRRLASEMSIPQTADATDTTSAPQYCVGGTPCGRCSASRTHAKSE
jgi:hypothetical protein